MTKAAIYARRSTDAQGASLDRQVAECERYIERHGWDLGPTYSDSTSAWKPNTPRSEFDRMVREAPSGEWQVLVVWEASRLSRQEGDDSALAVIWRLRKVGVDVHSVSELSTGNTLADDLSLLIKSHAAKEESDIKSKRVMSGKRRGMLEGIYQGASAPYGYRLAGERISGRRTIKVYEPDPQAARIVREIFDGYLTGTTPQVIADELTRRGIEPPGAGKAHRYQRRNEPVWHQGVIRGLIANPLVAGFQHYKGVRVKACRCLDTTTLLDEIKVTSSASKKAALGERWAHCEHAWVECSNISPAIIEAAVWERAQGVMAHRARPWAMGRTGDAAYTTHEFLLAGLLWCAHCGERVGARHDKHGRSKKKVGVYLCRGRRLGQGCSLPRLRAHEIDEAVRRSFVEGFVDVQATMERSREVLREQRNDEAKILRGELAEVERDLAEARAFMVKIDRDYGEGELGAASYERLHDQLIARLEQGQGARENLTARLDALTRHGTPTDALLDQANAIARMLRGEMETEDKAQLNQHLAGVFAEFRVSVDGGRIILDPHLRPEWAPPGEWHTLDFGEEGAAGVEVVDFVDPVLRKVDLWNGGATSPTYSS